MAEPRSLVPSRFPAIDQVTGALELPLDKGGRSERISFPMRMEKLTVSHHLLSAFLLTASPAWVMAQAPAPAPAPATVAPAVLNKLFEDAEAAFAKQDY